jgi:stress-induced morphogen
MATITGNSDSRLDAVKSVLDDYEHANQGAVATLYRQNSVSIRVKIIDPAFDGLDKPARHKKIWQFLEKLPEDVQGDITMLVLIAPEEENKSFASMMFEQREPSRL